MRTLIAVSLLIFLLPALSRADFTHIARAKNLSKIEIKTDDDVPTIASIKYIPKQIWLISASENLVCVWDMRTFEQKKRFYDKSFGKINAICADADAKFAYFCTGEPGKIGKLFKLDLQSGEHKIIFETADEIFAIAYSPANKRIAAGALNGELIVINCEDDSIIFKAKDENEKIVSLDFNEQGTFLAVAYASGRICARAEEDSYKTPAANFSARCVPVGLKFIPRSEKDIAVVAGYGTDSKILIFRNFQERLSREFRTPDFNASAFYARNMAHQFIIAGKDGNLAAYKSRPDEPEFFEAVNTRLESADRGAQNNVIAAGANGVIYAWQNFNGILIGGIVLQSADGADYAVWTSPGHAYATKENSIRFFNKNDKVIKDYTQFFDRKKVEDFLRTKNETQKPKTKADAEK